MTIDKIRRTIKGYKRVEKYDHSFRKAAVLIPLFEEHSELYVIFTKRTQKVYVHKGQFSFPGGSFERTDRSLEDTALREMKEEIGITPKTVDVFGCLDDLETVTNFVITPYVGLLNRDRNYVLNPFEIERLLEVPLDFLIQERHWHEEEYRHSGKTYMGEYCLYKGDKIWGVTGKIIRRFINILRGTL